MARILTELVFIAIITLITTTGDNYLFSSMASSMALACSLSTLADYTSSNIRFLPPNGTTYLRCSIDDKPKCYDDNTCPDNTFPMPALKRFSTYADCLNYQPYLVCRHSTTGAFSCAADIPGCPQDTFQYVEALTSLDACKSRLLTLKEKYVRCLSSTGRSCHVGLVTLASCLSTETMQPPNQAGFSTEQDCLDYQAKISCYSAATNSYSCVSDLTTNACNNDMQISNSMAPLACDNYKPPLYFVRCATTTGTICRPAAKIAFVDSNAETPAAQLLSPLSNACLNTEKVMNQVSTLPFITESSCTSYKLQICCYYYVNDVATKNEDYECIGTDRKTLNSGSTTDCTKSFSQFGFTRCVAADGTTATCRPALAGCYTATSESATLSSPTSTISRRFSLLADCKAYPVVAGRWLRCVTSQTKTCVYEACFDFGTAAQATDGSVLSFASEADCKA